MASLRKAKKQAKKEGRIFIDPTKEKKDLLRIVNAQVKETNKRLRQLDRKGFYNSFSSKKLFERLGSGRINALEKSGDKITGIKVKKNLTVTDLTAISKATRNFLNSSTSSPFKTKRLIRETKKSMFKTLKMKNDKLTMEDIETYYDMLGTEDFDYFADKYGSSEVWAVIEEAKEAGDNQNEFLKRFNTVITLNDVDVKRKAINLFNKYV